LKWMKKVEDFRSRWFFIDILEESELFLVKGSLPSSSTPGPARPFLRKPCGRSARESAISGRPVLRGPWSGWSSSPDASPPAGPPPGDLEAQVRRRPQAPHQRAQR
jgi:hypothetical protein